MKKTIFFTLFFLLLSLVFVTVSAGQTLYTPTQISYRGIWNKDVTQDFVIVSADYTGKIKVIDYWAEPGISERDLAFFNKSASEVGIHINYENEFYITEGGKYELKVTVRTDNPGLYHGLIAFIPIDSPDINIGAPSTWVTVDTRGIYLFPVHSPVNQSALTIKGLSSEEYLEIYLNREPAGRVEIKGGNNFTANVTLSEGNNTIFMKALGSDLRSNSIFVILDTTPPAPPTISTPQTIVNTSTITVSGKAEANSVVHIFVNHANQRDVSVSSSGNFTVSNIHLEEGNNTITAIAVDEAGNPSNESEPVYVLYLHNDNETTNKTKRLELSVDKRVITLPDEGNATCNVTASVLDANGTLINATLKINFSITSGNASLSAAVVETRGGKGRTVVECGEEGDVTIKAESPSPDIEGDSVTVTFKKPEPVSTDTNETVFSPSLPSETNATKAKNVSESELKKEGWGFFGIPRYLVIVIASLSMSLFLYAKYIGVKSRSGKQEGEGDKSTWMVSGIQKRGGEYEVAVNKEGKRTTIKLNEKLYRQLIRRKRLVLGRYTILIPLKR